MGDLVTQEEELNLVEKDIQLDETLLFGRTSIRRGIFTTNWLTVWLEKIIRSLLFVDRLDWSPNRDELFIDHLVCIRITGKDLSGNRFSWSLTMTGWFSILSPCSWFQTRNMLLDFFINLYNILCTYGVFHLSEIGNNCPWSVKDLFLIF